MQLSSAYHNAQYYWIPSVNRCVKIDMHVHVVLHDMEYHEKAFFSMLECHSGMR